MGIFIFIFMSFLRAYSYSSSYHFHVVSLFLLYINKCNHVCKYHVTYKCYMGDIQYASIMLHVCYAWGYSDYMQVSCDIQVTHACGKCLYKYHMIYLKKYIGSLLSCQPYTRCSRNNTLSLIIIM